MQPFSGSPATRLGSRTTAYNAIQMKTAPESVQVPGVSALRRLIRDVPDFPKPGILFKDITPLLADPAGLALAVELMVQPFRGERIDRVVAAESRGFIFGTAAAKALSVGFVPVRKPGKLPAEVRRHEYELEYGVDALEIHEDALVPGENVLVVDDLLATGGTLAACCQLVRGLGATVCAVVVLIELTELNGRQRLANERVVSILKY
jgi:adenine phosphoribosyltransferase